MNNHDGGLAYKPGLMGRVARVVLPVLHRILPFAIYRVVYSFLYGFYVRLLRIAYFFWMLVVRVTGTSRSALRAKLVYQLLPFTMGGRQALENAFDVTAMAEDRGIPGALVECGVAEGGTSAMLAMTNRCLGNTSRAKWLFDSYEGLPEPTQEDYEGGTTGDFIRPLPKGACLGTVEQVEELMFETLCFSQNDTFLIKGWFQDSVPRHRARIGDIAVLRLDGDWYESTKIPLENLYDFVSPGGFVIIDDYGTCFGSRKAVDEFRRERRLESPLNSDGRGGVWFEKPRDDTD